MPPSSTPPAGSDRRKHRRAPLEQPVLVEGPSGGAPIKARNVSGGGLALEGALAAEVGAVVEVYFELPIGYAVEAQARVVRKAANVTALHFQGLDREAEVALRSYCRISGLREAQPGPTSTSTS